MDHETSHPYWAIYTYYTSDRIQLFCSSTEKLQLSNGVPTCPVFTGLVTYYDMSTFHQFRKKMLMNFGESTTLSYLIPEIFMPKTKSCIAPTNPTTNA